MLSHRRSRDFWYNQRAVTPDDKISFLRTTEILGKVPEVHLRDLVTAMTEVEIPAGSTIFYEGDPADAVYIIVSGEVRVEKDAVVVAICGKGEWLGELAVLDDAPRSATAIVQTHATLLKITRTDFEESLHKTPEIASGISRMLIKKVHKYTSEHVQRIKETAPVVSIVSSPQVLTLFANRYYIEKELSHSGISKVYKANDRILGVPVALKVIIKVGESEPEVLRRFKREVILARRVSHPHACRLYDLGEVGGIYYVSMEYVDGVTLSDVMKFGGPMSMADGIPLMLQILNALREVHRVGIIHRDVKPHNIMVTSEHFAQLMDFGISISSDVSRYTEMEDIMGTPAYMSPEQFQGGVLDQRSDLYSVGVILFEMFTGGPPFHGTTMWQLMQSHLQKAPPTPSSILHDIPAGMDNVILRALEKKPEKRFQTADEMILALERLRSAS